MLCQTNMRISATQLDSMSNSNTGHECLMKTSMSVLGFLQALFIRMSKHPSCFRLTGDILTDWTEGEGRRVLLSNNLSVMTVAVHILHVIQRLDFIV